MIKKMTARPVAADRAGAFSSDVAAGSRQDPKGRVSE
jgi:hypothetical protein